MVKKKFGSAEKAVQIVKLSNGQWPLKSVQSVLEATDAKAVRLDVEVPAHLAVIVVQEPVPCART